MKRIDGIIGTTLFYHFLATLDYPRGELVLRRKDAKSLEEFKAAQAKRVAVPSGLRATTSWWAGVAWRRSHPRSSSLTQGWRARESNWRSRSSRRPGSSWRKTKLTKVPGGGGTLKIVPYTVHRLSFGDIKEENVAGLYDGPFPWENTFGFHLAGMVGHDFFKPYAVTFDFKNMQIFLQ